jgi:hypothetical protein
MIRPGHRIWRPSVTGYAGWPRPSLLAGLAAGEFADDVQVADVAGVLLEQVEQDPPRKNSARAGTGVVGSGKGTVMT